MPKRTESFSGRCTPEIKTLAGEIKARQGLSEADIFEQAVLSLAGRVVQSPEDRLNEAAQQVIDGQLSGDGLAAMVKMHLAGQLGEKIVYDEDVVF